MLRTTAWKRCQKFCKQANLACPAIRPQVGNTAHITNHLRHNSIAFGQDVCPVWQEACAVKEIGKNGSWSNGGPICPSNDNCHGLIVARLERQPELRQRKRNPLKELTDCSVLKEFGKFAGKFCLCGGNWLEKLSIGAAGLSRVIFAAAASGLWQEKITWSKG